MAPGSTSALPAQHRQPPCSVAGLLRIAVIPAKPWPVSDLEIQSFSLLRRQRGWRLVVKTRLPACQTASRTDDRRVEKIDEEAAFYLGRIGLPFEGRTRLVSRERAPLAWQVIADDDVLNFALGLPADICRALEAMSAHHLLALCSPRQECEILFTSR